MLALKMPLHTAHAEALRAPSHAAPPANARVTQIQLSCTSLVASCTLTHHLLLASSSGIPVDLLLVAQGSGVASALCLVTTL